MFDNLSNADIIVVWFSGFVLLTVVILAIIDYRAQSDTRKRWHRMCQGLPPYLSDEEYEKHVDEWKNDHWGQGKIQ